MKLFRVNDNLCYSHNPWVEKNTFLNAPAEKKALPLFSQIEKELPMPVWDGHDDVVVCCRKAWEIAFSNLRQPDEKAGFVSNFIDTAFNGYLFMWDSSFIVMFGRYGSRVFDFQKTLDNFYSHQHRDGFICREICETQPGEQFTRDDPASTGPNILAWAEWDYFCATDDIERLRKVFDPLCAYHRWLQLNRSWPDGGYWSCGLACGMDNQPRQAQGYDPFSSHGHMTWIDTCCQQLLSADILIRMAEKLGRSGEVDWLQNEEKFLRELINTKMWDDKSGFYYDTYRGGETSNVKSIAAYWALISGAASPERAERLAAHLENESEFKRFHRVPSLSADHPLYNENGDYWKGSVWAPTNYMILKGLEKYGCHKLAYDIACNHLERVTEVFNNTGTLWENYSSEKPAPGIPAKKDFVGWTGIVPISVLFEYVFGIHPDALNRHIEWRINRTERHGVTKYPLGDIAVELICEERSSVNEKPRVRVICEAPVTVDIIWEGGCESLQSSPYLEENRHMK